MSLKSDPPVSRATGQHSLNHTINDPRYIGPGTWFAIHLKARHANTPTKKREFTEFMWMIAHDFKCKTCAEHCRKYLEDHPITSYYDVKSSSGEEIGCFKWSWMFHNAVNSRIGKPIVDWNTAYGMYFTESAVCEIGCEDKPKQHGKDTKAKAKDVPRRSDPEPLTLVKSSVKTTPAVYVIKGDKRVEQKVQVKPILMGRRQ